LITVDVGVASDALGARRGELQAAVAISATDSAMLPSQCECRLAVMVKLQWRFQLVPARSDVAGFAGYCDGAVGAVLSP
jgi:hypothetical protein